VFSLGYPTERKREMIERERERERESGKEERENTVPLESISRVIIFN